MQFTTTLLAAVLASVAVAHPGFSVPEGTVDGVYKVSINETGHEVHEAVKTTFGSKFKARSSALSSRVPASVLEARGNGIGCNKNMPLNPADTDTANSMLDAQCGGWTNVSPYDNFYSVSGNVVAYFCNQCDWSYGCSSGARVTASADITGQCGQYNAGWQTFTQAPSGLGGDGQWVYGYAATSNKFCGDGI